LVTAYEEAEREREREREAELSDVIADEEVNA
jgi:hypothetical protein